MRTAARILRGAFRLDRLRRLLRRSAPAVEPEPAEGSWGSAYEARHNGWMRRLHFPPIAFYTELWRDPREEPSFPAMAEKYGEKKAESEVSFLQTHLPDEVVTAAVGLLYTLGRIESILAELQAYVDEHVPRPRKSEPWPKRGVRVGHALVVEATFEVANFLSWLRTFDERLDRPHLPGSEKREGLLPALADRPLRARVEKLVTEFRRTTLERTLANYQLHAAAVTQPLEGAPLSRDHRVSLPIPDRTIERIASRWHLSYDDDREALPVAREAARAVESLVDDVIDAFEHESQAVESERRHARSP
jgi:hypothetical protein